MIRDLIKPKLVIVEPDEKVAQAAKVMEKENVGAVLILDEGKPRGIVTDRDIVVRCIAENIDVDDCTVENIMTETLETCRDTDGIYDVIQKMQDAKVRRIPIVDRTGRAIGVVSFGDILAVLGKEISGLASSVTPAEKKLAA